MNICYLRDDNEIDAERCRISLREKSPITLLTLDGAGYVVSLTGVVQSLQFDTNRASGRRWLAAIMHDAAHFSDLSSERAVAIRPAGSV
jgi:hypothetical protein